MVLMLTVLTHSDYFLDHPTYRPPHFDRVLLQMLGVLTQSDYSLGHPQLGRLAVAEDSTLYCCTSHPAQKDDQEYVDDPLT